MQAVLTIRTSGPGLHEFTAEVVRFVREAGVEQGLLTLFVQHTSCSLWVTAGRPALGQWQGIYLFEHRHRAHSRRVVAHLSA